MFLTERVGFKPQALFRFQKKKPSLGSGETSQWIKHLPQRHTRT